MQAVERKKELTPEQKAHLEAICSATEIAIIRLKDELAKLESGKKVSENLLRDYGYPVLSGGKGRQCVNKVLAAIAADCERGEDESLIAAMNTKTIEIPAIQLPVR